MKIVHLYKDYYPVLGGIENHIRVLAEAQSAAGHEVTVLVCDPGPRTRTETVGGVHVIRAGRMATAASMPLSVAQPWALMHLQPDIVHIQSPYPLGEAANWAFGRARATVISHQSDIVRQKRFLPIYGPVLRRVLRAADRIIASSPRYIETSPWLGPVHDKCVVVPLGVDTVRFSPTEHDESGPPRLIFVGRLRYYKGLDTLLQALPHVPDVVLSIIGDGPMRETLEAMTRELRLGGRVTFAGEVDDAELPDRYRGADVFVLPANARAEAFGTVLIEAMACGLPCITTELGTGTSWIVQDGVTGLVVPPMDAPALAEAIRKMRNASQREQMGRASRARVCERFTQQRMVDQVMQVYSDALSGAEGRGGG